jgi:hypothetical protein
MAPLVDDAERSRRVSSSFKVPAGFCDACRKRSPA